MKKAFALLLALCLLVIAPASLADTVRLTETASAFDLSIDLPDGAAVSVETYDDVPYTFVTFADETMPLLYISVAPTELYTDMSMSDLTTEEQQTLFETISADFDAPSFEMKQTSSGHAYMLINDDSATDSATLVTLYSNYFVQMSVWDTQYGVLSQEDIATAESLLSTLQVVPD